MFFKHWAANSFTTATRHNHARTHRNTKMANDPVDDIVENLFADQAGVRGDTESIEDRAVAVYFKKLEEYTQHRAGLTEQLGVGFQHLSRANYASQGRKFDRTCWDNTVQATRRLGWSAKKQYKLDVKSASEEAAEARDKARDMSRVSVKDVEKLKKRKSKAKKEGDGEDDDFIYVEVPKVYNPLDMFSTFPPLPLRQAQAGFEKAVDSMEAAARVMWDLAEIEKVVFVDKDVERMRKVVEKDEQDEKEQERLWMLQQQERLDQDIKDRKMQYSICKKKGLAPK